MRSGETLSGCQPGSGWAALIGPSTVSRPGSAVQMSGASGTSWKAITAASAVRPTSGVRSSSSRSGPGTTSTAAIESTASG